MRIIIGTDHGGFELKERIKHWLVQNGNEVIDVGACTYVEDDDFVDFAKAAVVKAKKTDDKIILFCKNGFGMSIAANRFIGVRCGIAFDVEAVRRGRTDDDINCLSIPAEYIDEAKVKEIIDVFIKESFSLEEKYKRRIIKLDNLF